MQDNHHDDNERVDRRGMLRKAGFIAAGAAGAAVAGTAATPAHAAEGDPVTLGADNDGGTAATTVRNNSVTNPALALRNNGVDSLGDGGPALTLPPSTSYYMSSSAPAGSMMLARDGFMMVAPPDSAGTPVHNQYVYDSYNATFTVPVIPARALDTRKDRSRLFGTSGAIDSSGRLIGGATVHLDISDMIQYSYGVFFNVSAVDPTNTGYMRIWPYGQPKPNATCLNWQKGQNITNGTNSAVGYRNDTRSDVLSIFANVTTHVVVDITAVVISHWGSFHEVSLAPAVATAGVGAVGTAAADDVATRRQQGFAKKIAKWSSERG